MEQFFELPDGRAILFNPDSHWHGWLHYRDVDSGALVPFQKLERAPQPYGPYDTNTRQPASGTEDYLKFEATDELIAAAAYAMVLLGQKHRSEGRDGPSRREDAKAALQAVAAIVEARREQAATVPPRLCYWDKAASCDCITMCDCPHLRLFRLRGQLTEKRTAQQIIHDSLQEWSADEFVELDWNTKAAKRIIQDLAREGYGISAVAAERPPA